PFGATIMAIGSRKYWFATSMSPPPLLTSVRVYRLVHQYDETE
ncbi:hypothetical protein D030_4074B, partial [Vibrio parahaemolyticus AQ3810]